MTKRYFKATDGKTTVYRSSDTRVYQSASWRLDKYHNIAFSGSPPVYLGAYPAVEINKAEYERLAKLKDERVNRIVAGRQAEGERCEKRWFSSPNNSWVENAVL